MSFADILLTKNKIGALGAEACVDVSSLIKKKLENLKRSIKNQINK